MSGQVGGEKGGGRRRFALAVDGASGPRTPWSVARASLGHAVRGGRGCLAGSAGAKAGPAPRRSMGGVFVIDWQVPGIQNRVSTVEAMENHVCGTGAEHPERVADAILVTEPDVVVAWANSHPEWTLEVLRGLHRVVARPAGEGGGVAEAPSLPPFVFVDSRPEDREELERWAPRAAFTTTYGDLQSVIRKAVRGK